MEGRKKDTIVYRYDPRRRYFLVSLHLENKPGAIGNLANVLGIRGINILEGFFGAIDSGQKGTMSFFLESTNPKMDEGWLNDFLSSLVYVTDVEVKSATEGWLSDTLNFPVTWNTGDRAVLMRVEALRGMIEAVKAANPETGASAIYDQGYAYGRTAWDGLLGVHRPSTKEGLAEMLQIFTATGWAKVEMEALDLNHMKARVGMSDGFECMERSTGRSEGHFIAGVLAGAFAAYFGTEVRAEETKCLSKGDSHCVFEIAPADRT